MERNIHGFKYEEKIISKFELTEEKDYTGKNDAYYKGIPVQIKCIKKNSSIDMGDYFRNANKEKDFILVIGFWEGKKDNIVEEYFIYINIEKWNNLLKYEYSHMMKESLKYISNDKADDLKWKAFCKEWRDLYKKDANRKIHLRFKRDHKKQKRIQCAINKKDFYGYFLKEFDKVKWEEKGV